MRWAIHFWGPILRKSIIVAAALALAGCVSAPVDGPKPPPASQKASKPARAKPLPMRLEGYQHAAIENAVKGHLKDPYSAVFSSMMAFRDQGSRAVHVCGIVNAKNSFGGYTGGKSFYAMARYEVDGSFNTRDLFVTLESAISESMIRQFCL